MIAIPGATATRHGPAGPWTFAYSEARGTRFSTDQNGTSFMQDVDYQPFGEATSTGAATIGTTNYTSEQWNGGDALAALGITQLGARLYDPTIGRFLSRDPMFDPGNLNAYAFAGNDPINNSDPSGMCGFLCIFTDIFGGGNSGGNFSGSGGGYDLNSGSAAGGGDRLSYGHPNYGGPNGSGGTLPVVNGGGGSSCDSSCRAKLEPHPSAPKEDRGEQILRDYEQSESGYYPAYLKEGWGEPTVAFGPPIGDPSYGRAGLSGIPARR